MTLELRVTGGARAGARERFEKSVVTIGRHPLSDLRLDASGDLDVSTRHGELRHVDGVWVLHDLQSTNGTFVNGERIAASRAVHDGDIVTFGRNGPTVEVRTDAVPLVPATNMVSSVDAPERPSQRAVPSTPVSAAAGVTGAARKDTTIRIAEAVQQQTASLKRWVGAGAAVMLAAAAVAALLWHQQTSAREREMQALVSRSDSASLALQKRIEALAVHDSASARTLATQAAQSRQAGRALAQGMGGRDSVLYSKRLSAQTSQLASLAQMDLAGLHLKNDAAVAMIASDLDGTFIAGTAFGVSRSGLLVTNRHVVRTASGQPARRVRVIFANTTDWVPAHVVRMDDTDDLALLQLDVAGSYPVVSGVSRTGALARVGSAVASIGYPHAVDTPMEGSGGLHVRAATTLTGGTVSKRLDDVIQIDSYAGKGSSGSPLFDARGNVVGVVYGGAAESGGRIVYAVPAQRLAAFLGSAGEGVLRD